MLILGIAGSLRRASFNRGLLRAVQEQAPSDVRFEIFDLIDVPLYNGDVEALGDPPSVAELKARIREADGLLIAAPEYNYSISGVLKNALDWASRPPAPTALQDRPVALMGASPGPFGTARSQLAVRQALLGARARVMPGPELYVASAGTKFDQDGNLLDEETRNRAARVLNALVSWLRPTES